MVHNKETKDQKEKIKMNDKTTKIPKEDILELLNELENEEKNNESRYFDRCFLCRGHYFKPCDQLRCVG